MNTKLEKLVEQYKKELSQRQLTKKSHLESVREFAGKYHCSPTTAAAVFKHLLAEGIVSSVPGKGYFLQKNPARKKKIGYLGYTPSPLLDSILNDASGALLDHLNCRKEDAKILLLQFYAMQDPAVGKKLLRKLDGLLLNSNFVDKKTLPALRAFNKPIVLVGAVYLEDRLICNQVIADFSTALRDFCQHCDLDRYKNIVVLQTSSRNCIATARQIVNYLNMTGTAARITVQETGHQVSNNNITYGYDLAQSLTADDIENTLYISLGWAISYGMYSYMQINGLSTDVLPDILCVDNFENYDHELKRPTFFTAIDRSFKECFIQGAELLFKQINQSSANRIIVQVPTKLVIRKSVRNIVIKDKEV
ncbi:MAG: hypothetical protein E7039_03325 [Lentisphaerae bacterium]|nr:hypothetical protein [Lentisphaerota bacterium]